MEDIDNLLEKSGSLQEAKGRGSVVVYVTNRMLVDDEGTRLLLTTNEERVLISTWWVSRQSGPSIETEAGRRYVASAIALETVHSRALNKADRLLPRDRDVYRGCLYDYFGQPADYVQRTQNPKLCALEASAVKAQLGVPVLVSLERTLTRIGQSAP